MRRIIVVLCLCLMWSSTAQDDGFPLGRDFYVEAFVSDETPYLNEQIIYTFRYYTYTMPSGFFEDLPDFRGFWLSDVYELTSPRIETINQRQYNVFEVYALISPTQTGTLTIQPAILEIPETLFREPLSLATEALDVTVLPLPANAPELFSGAVGQFSLDVETDMDTVSIGQPVRLSVTLSGAGNFEQLTAPVLPELVGWRVYPESSQYEASSIGGLQLGEKTFEWLLVPDQTGTQTLPPVRFSYFNPEEAVYRTLSDEPRIVDVFPGESERVNRPESVEADVLALLPVVIGDSDATISSNPLFWFLWLIAPLLAFGTGASIYGRRWLQAQQIRRRRRNALKMAVAQIHDGHVEAGIIRYFTDKTNSDSLHFDDLQVIFDKKGLDLQLLETLTECYFEAQGVRYAPVSIDVGDVATRTTRVLEEIDHLWS